MNNIPNTITCLNVLSGTIAILMASKGENPVCGSLTGIQWAWIFIGIAAVADFCDGLAARLLHAYSNLGKELDSLCDLVSFGVAPAIVLINTLQSCGETGWSLWAPVLIPVAAALRLAKFNIDTRQSTSFLGLPVPANAIFWIGYSALLRDGGNLCAGSWWGICAATALLCWLMVSEIPLFSLKLKSLNPKDSWRQLILIGAAILLVLTLGVSGLAWLILFYVAFSMAAKS